MRSIIVDGAALEGTALLEFINDNCALLDTKLTSISLSEKVYVVSAILRFSDCRGVDGQLELHFLDIVTFDFYYDNHLVFYNVERYKLLNSSEGFYLSIDPFDESDEISEKDCGVIRSKSLKGYILDK